MTMRRGKREGVVPAAQSERRSPWGGHMRAKKGNVSWPRQTGPPSSVPRALGAQGPPPRVQQVRNLSTQQDLPFLAMRMQFSRVSWRTDGSLSTAEAQTRPSPGGNLRQLGLGPVRTKDAPPGRKAWGNQEGRAQRAGAANRAKSYAGRLRSAGTGKRDRASKIRVWPRSTDLVRKGEAWEGETQGGRSLEKSGLPGGGGPRPQGLVKAGA